MCAFQGDLTGLLPDLNRFARSLTRNEDDAYDLVHDRVERALNKRALFQDMAVHPDAQCVHQSEAPRSC